jgi:hypothetical protein
MYYYTGHCHYQFLVFSKETVKVVQPDLPLQDGCSTLILLEQRTPAEKTRDECMGFYKELNVHSATLHDFHHPQHGVSIHD